MYNCIIVKPLIGSDIGLSILRGKAIDLPMKVDLMIIQLIFSQHCRQLLCTIAVVLQVMGAREKGTVQNVCVYITGMCS